MSRIRGSSTGSHEREREHKREDGWRGAVWATVPNRITALRLAALPFLWLLAALHETGWLALGLALTALTDVADGIIARRSGAMTTFGSRLDSVADHLLTVSTVAWLVWLRPEFIARERVLLGVWIAVGTISLLAGWIRFRRIGGLHLYSAKIAGVAGYLFAVWVLLSPRYPRWVFVGVIALAVIAALETLAVFLSRTRVDEHAGSIFLSRAEPGPGGRGGR